MTSKSPPSTPESARQAIEGADPGQIPAKRWGELFAAYAGCENGAQNIAPQKTKKEWEIFERFLNGEIDHATYYEKSNILRNQIETIADDLADERFDAYRQDLNTALYRLTQQTKEGLHWKEQADKPATRMYLDIARLLNRRLITSIKDTARYLRNADEAHIDNAITVGFNEALLLSSLDICRFDGFVANVIHKRIIDFNRGRHKDVPYTPDILATASVPDHTQAIERDWEVRELLDELRTFAHTTLPDQQKKVLLAVLDASPDRVDFSEIADKISMNRNTFYAHIRFIRKRITPNCNFFGDPLSPVGPEEQPLSTEVRNLKVKIYNFFNDQNTMEVFSLKQLAIDTGLDKGTISALMGQNNVQNPAEEALSNNVLDKLSNYLEQHDKGDKVGEFTSLFMAMRTATNYIGKHGRSSARQHNETSR